MKLQTALSISALLLLAGCNKGTVSGTTGAVASSGGSTASSGDAANAKPVAVVNGEVITRQAYDTWAKNLTGRNSADLPPDIKTKLLDSIVGATAVAQQATKDGIDKTPATMTNLQFATTQVLAQAEVENYLKDHKATDADIKAAYDKTVAALPKTEYHARHILVKTADEAQKIIDQLKHGAKFEKLAAQSIDPGSKAKGGDLGWFPPQGMVKPFADAVQALKKDQITDAPVQSQFGFHVIQLLDTRPSTQPVPTLESLKPRLERQVQQEKVQALEDSLVKAAKIEKNAP